MKNNKPYKIYLSPPWQNGREHALVKEALDSNWLAPGGPHVDRFEDELKIITGRKNCVALSSGTAAIHLALKSLDVGPGDYVICQTFCFVALANPIVYLGAIPVFIDSERETWNMDPNLLDEAIKDLAAQGIVPKAILYAHIYGMPAKVSEIVQIAEQYDIPLIEDAAEALGSTIHGTSVGRYGKISIFSFNGNKIVTTSGGGALLTDDDNIAREVLHLASQAKDPSSPYLHNAVGYNYKLSNVCAALGLAQLQSLDERVAAKKRIFDIYKESAAEKSLMQWVENRHGADSNRWLSTFLLKNSTSPDYLMSAFEELGIETRRFWKPLHSLQIYRSHKAYVNGVSDELFDMGICLPSGLGMSAVALGTIKSVLSSLK